MMPALLMNVLSALLSALLANAVLSSANLPAQALAAQAVSQDGAAPVAKQTRTIRYGRDIRPLLSDRCFRCHGPDATQRAA